MRKFFPASVPAPLSYFSLLHFFRLQKTRSIVCYIILLAFLHLAVGCNYYRVQKEDKVSAQKFANIPNYKRFILHQGNNKWELQNVSIQPNAIEGNLKPVTGNLLLYINPKPGVPN